MPRSKNDTDPEIPGQTTERVDSTDRPRGTDDAEGRPARVDPQPEERPYEKAISKERKAELRAETEGTPII